MACVGIDVYKKEQMPMLIILNCKVEFWVRTLSSLSLLSESSS